MARRPADFSEATKGKLAARAGHECSYCQAPTSGPSSEPNGTVNLGEAGHITAASPGGPRFDSSLTDEQRASAENGIWLCRTDAALVDRDGSDFTEEQLLRIRTNQVSRARARLRGAPSVDSRLQLQLDALAIHEIRRAEFALHALEPQDYARGIAAMLPFAGNLRYGSEVRMAFVSVLDDLANQLRGSPLFRDPVKLQATAEAAKAIQHALSSSGVLPSGADSDRDAQVLILAIEAGGQLAHDGILYTQDLRVVDSGSEIMWMVMRRGRRKRNPEVLRKGREEFEAAIEAAIGSHWTHAGSARELLEFRLADATAARGEEPRGLPDAFSLVHQMWADSGP